MSVTKARCSWLQRVLIQRLWEIGRASGVAIGGWGCISRGDRRVRGSGGAAVSVGDGGHGDRIGHKSQDASIDGEECDGVSLLASPGPSPR